MTTLDRPVVRRRSRLANGDKYGCGVAIKLVCQCGLAGPLEGWDGETVFELSNGELWRQSAYRTRRLHLNNPTIRVWQCGEAYWIEVAGTDEILPVQRSYTS